MFTAILLLAAANQQFDKTFTIDGIERKSIILIGNKTKNAPVIFAFHGHGGNARYAARKFDFRTEWPEATVICMEGLPTKGMTDPEGKKNGWQQKPSDENGRDLKFFDSVYRYAMNDLHVDPDRVYSMGHSNGARFTYVLWSERGNKFAAFAAASAPATGLIRNFKPKPIFAIAGESDQIVPYAGQKLSISLLRNFLKTDTEHATTDGYFRLEKGSNGNDLATYIYPGGHQFQDETISLMADFFKAHVRR